MSWDVQMQIQGFLIESGSDHAIIQSDGEVHKVNLVGASTEFPGQPRGIIDPLLEGLPCQLIQCGIREAEPYSKDVIYEAFV